MRFSPVLQGAVGMSSSGRADDADTDVGRTRRGKAGEASGTEHVHGQKGGNTEDNSSCPLTHACRWISRSGRPLSSYRPGGGRESTLFAPDRRCPCTWSFVSRRVYQKKNVGPKKNFGVEYFDKKARHGTSRIGVNVLQCLLVVTLWLLHVVRCGAQTRTRQQQLPLNLKSRAEYQRL